MKRDLEQALERWIGAGLLSHEDGDRIRAWESAREPDRRIGWAEILGMALGGILLAAGVALLVRSQWERLPLAGQTAFIVVLVSIFHVLAGLGARFSGNLAMILHGVGTLALGVGILLISDIYQVSGHWSGAMLVWTVGSVVAWWLLRDWVQLGLLAAIGPMWLVSVWDRALGTYSVWPGAAIAAGGLYLLSIVYFGSDRTVLRWIGGIAAIPCAFLTAVAPRSPSWLGAELQIPGWTVALGLPIAISWLLRRDVLPALIAAAGAVLIILSSAASRTPLPYAACALNAVGVAVWGIVERRPERINLGIGGFALAVMAFFFSDIFDKLGQAAGLIVVGVLFLAGGWYLERLRRRLVTTARGEPA